MPPWDSYKKQKDALHAGRKPREQAEGTTLKELVNAFLNQKEALKQSGELLARTWNDYKFACDLAALATSKYTSAASRSQQHLLRGS